MDKQLEKELKNRFAHFFRKEDAPVNEQGIRCGDGWFHILENLMHDLQKIDKNTTIVEIKERFGELKFFANSNNMGQLRMLEAEEESKIVCEECGRPGQTTWKAGMVKTVCPEHEEAKDVVGEKVR